MIWYSGTRSFRSQRQTRRRTVRAQRRLAFESLETRRLLAQATLVEQFFRADDFSVSASFSYEFHRPGTYDYIDKIPNGTFTSESGRVTWTSPQDGNGFFEGAATGDGRSTVYAAGARRECAKYGFEDLGQIDFSLDASQSRLIVDHSEPTSTRYTWYHDSLDGRCAAPNPPPSRFFGGVTNLYAGTFDTSNHTVTIRYEQTTPDEVNVVTKPAPVQWADQDATDFVLTLLPYQPHWALSEGWVGIPQTSPSPPTDLIDLEQGGLEFVVDMHGQPLKTTDALQPAATVRLFWASSDTDTSGAEIPLTSTTDPVGLYWNSSQLHAVVERFPAAPPDATHVRVQVDAPGGIDANPANNSRYLRIGSFHARNAIGGPITADVPLDGLADSVLHESDRSDPAIKVYAYHPRSALGATVQIVDDRGAYQYDPRAVQELQALSPGETVQDAVSFWAVKDQAIVSAATYTILVQGVNDAPQAGDDTAATTNFQVLPLLSGQLLANDSDVDHWDQVAVKSVAAASQRGASVRVVQTDAKGRILEVAYDPSTSGTLRGLLPGQQLVDEFEYEITDAHGGTATARVTVTVTGEADTITIAPVLPQVTARDVPLPAIALVMTDRAGDAGGLQVTATAADSSLVAAGGLQIQGSGDTRTLEITPAAGVTGRTWITVTAEAPLGRSAAAGFPLVIGTADDLDLDGAPNDEEDAAPNGGDMNGDGIPDSRQANVAVRRIPGQEGHYFQLVVPVNYFLARVGGAESPAPSGPAANALFPAGLIHYEILLDSAGASSTVTFRTSLPTPPLNRYFQHDESAPGGQGWSLLMRNAADGARVFADRIEVLARDGGRVDRDQTADGRISGDAGLAHVDHPWQNILPADVDNDGRAGPQDVLLLINYLNSGFEASLGKLPRAGQFLPAFLDPTGDDRLEAVDVLRVINHLNQAATSGGEGEAAGMPGTQGAVQPLRSRLGCRDDSVAIRDLSLRHIPQDAGRLPQASARRLASRREASAVPQHPDPLQADAIFAGLEAAELWSLDP